MKVAGHARPVPAASSWAVWRTFVGAQIRSETTYRASFMLTVLTRMLVTGLDIVATLAFFSVVERLGGWTQSQVLLLTAASLLSFGLADLIASPVELTSQYVRTGEMDRLLVRPASVYVQLLGKEFAFRRIARIIEAALMVPAVLVFGDLPGGDLPARCVLFVVMVIGGTLAMSGLFALTSALAFWSPNTNEVANAFTYGGLLVTQYPTHLFTGWVRRAAMYTLPYGVCFYFPAISVVGGENPLGIPTWLQWAGPLVGVPVFAVGLAVWHLGLRHYEGTGS